MVIVYNLYNVMYVWVPGGWALSLFFTLNLSVIQMMLISGGHFNMTAHLLHVATRTGKYL